MPLIQYLRNEYNDTSVPIILAEDTRAGAAWIDTNLGQEQDEKRQALHTAFETLIAQGVENLFYVSRDALFNFTEFGYQEPVLNPTAAGTCVLYLSSPTFPTQKEKSNSNENRYAPHGSWNESRCKFLHGFDSKDIFVKLVCAGGHLLVTDIFISDNNWIYYG